MSNTSVRVAYSIGGEGMSMPACCRSRWIMCVCWLFYREGPSQQSPRPHHGQHGRQHHTQHQQQQRRGGQQQAAPQQQQQQREEAGDGAPLNSHQQQQSGQDAQQQQHQQQQQQQRQGGRSTAGGEAEGDARQNSSSSGVGAVGVRGAVSQGGRGRQTANHLLNFQYDTRGPHRVSMRE